MGKKVSKILIVFVILLIILCGGIAFAYFFTDIFKSDKEMFFEYISQNIEILEIFNDEDLNNYRDKLQTTAYTSNGSIVINDFDQSGLDENTANVISGSSITFTGSKDPVNNYTYRSFNLNYSETESMIIEYANIEDYYGIKIDNVLSSFVAIENNNLKTFATTLGLDEETINDIPDKIELDNLTSLELFTDEEIETLKSNYKTLFAEILSDDMFSKSETEEYTIYTLTLTYNQAKTVVGGFLEQLRDDEIIFNTIREFIIQNLEFSETEADEYISQIKENIQEYIDDLNNISTSTTSEDNNNFVINVYVQDKSLVKTELLSAGDGISITKSDSGFSIGLLENSETITDSISVNKTKTADTLEYSVEITENSGSGSSVYAGDTLYDTYISFNITYTGLSTLNQVQETFTYTASKDSTTAYSYTYNNSKNFNISGITQEVTTDDMLSLNTAPSAENIESLFEQIEARLDEVHSGIMNNLGISTDPFIYYTPAIEPLAITLGMQSEISSLTTALPIGLIFYYYNASSTIGENSLLNEVTEESAIATAQETIASDLEQIISDYNTAVSETENPFDGTLIDYVRQNWASSDESVYTVDEITVTIVGTDISGEVQEDGTINWTDNSENTNVSSSLNDSEIASFNNTFTPYIGSNVSGAQVNALITLVISSNTSFIASGSEQYVTISFTDENGDEQTIDVQDGEIYYSNESGSTRVTTGVYYTVTAIYNVDGYIESITVSEN